MTAWQPGDVIPSDRMAGRPQAEVLIAIDCPAGRQVLLARHSSQQGALLLIVADGQTFLWGPRDIAESWTIAQRVLGGQAFGSRMPVSAQALAMAGAVVALKHLCELSEEALASHGEPEEAA